MAKKTTHETIDRQGMHTSQDLPTTTPGKGYPFERHDYGQAEDDPTPTPKEPTGSKKDFSTKR